MNELMEFFIEPFQYPFMQRAIIAAVIIGIACAILSCYMVLKGWSLMGDAISHAVLPGVVLAYVTAIPLTIGAFLSGLFCSFATGYLKEHSRIKEDTVMGIVFSGMFAVGLVIFASVDTDQHLMHILFGNILGITPDVLIQISAICLITITIMLVKQKDFMLYCFDPNQARIVGLPVALLHYGLLSILALTIVASMQAVGIILVVAMLISPGITAYLLTRSFSRMITLAILFLLYRVLLVHLSVFILTVPQALLLYSRKRYSLSLHYSVIRLNWQK